MQWLSHLEKKLATSYWVLPPDLHERQRYIASQLPPRQSILDVGGEQRILEKKLKAEKYLTLNIRSDSEHFNHHQVGQDTVVYDGKQIPLESRSFDWVISIDVIEHVPTSDREDLIREMLRVSKRGLILSAPLGTQLHIDRERRLLHYLREKNHQVRFLEEHLERGLPRPEEVSSWAKKHHGQLSYSGSVFLSNWLLKIQVSKLESSLLNRVWFWCRLGIYGFFNLVLYQSMVGHNNYRSSTNRFYLKILIKSSAKGNKK